MEYNQEDLQPERKHTAQRIKTVLDMAKNVFTGKLMYLVFEHYTVAFFS